MYKTSKDGRAPRELHSFGGLWHPCGETSAHPEILQEVISQINQLRFGRAHLKNFGDSALQFEVVYFVKSGNYMDFAQGQHALNLALVQRFQEENIRFGLVMPNLKVDLNTHNPINLN